MLLKDHSSRFVEKELWEGMTRSRPAGSRLLDVWFGLGGSSGHGEDGQSWGVHEILDRQDLLTDEV